MWATKEQVSICYSDVAGFPFSAGIISSLNFTLNCLSYVRPEVHSDRAVDFCSKNCACVPKVLLQLSLSSSSSMAVDHRYSSRCPTAQDWFPQFAQECKPCTVKQDAGQCREDVVQMCGTRCVVLCFLEKLQMQMYSFLRCVLFFSEMCFFFLKTLPFL